MRTLVLALVLVLAGCGGSGYRVVHSAHEVELTEQLALAPTSAPFHDDAEALASLDEALARGLEASTREHRFERSAGSGGFTLAVELSALDAADGRTRLAGEVTILDPRGAVVDELEVSFDHAGDESAAGEELGRRIGHYLSHRERYHL